VSVQGWSGTLGPAFAFTRREIRAVIEQASRDLETGSCDGAFISTNMMKPGPGKHGGSCAGVRAKVYEFLDEELAPPDRRRVDAHLAACPPCAGHFAYERAFLAVVERRATIDEAPAELRERIRAALAMREEARRRR
jgi:mycothiol system anti-sigma-R factor